MAEKSDSSNDTSSGVTFQSDINESNIFSSSSSFNDESLSQFASSAENFVQQESLISTTLHLLHKTQSEDSTSRNNDSTEELDSADTLFEVGKIALTESAKQAQLFEASEYENRPKVQQPSWTGNAVCHYIGVMTASEAAKFITKPQSFLLYHKWDVKADEDTLPLYLVYKSVNTNSYHTEVQRNYQGYYVQGRTFQHLTNLVDYYAEAHEWTSTDIFDINLMTKF